MDHTRKTTMPDKIRAAMKKMAPDEQPVHVSKLALALDLTWGDDKRAMHSAIKDMVKTGEICRLGKGVLVYRGLDKKPDIKSAMWAVLRMKRTVTISDLQELSSASVDYAKEFLGMLVKRGCVERIPQKGRIVFRLIDDEGPETPMDTKKAEKLRRIREEKKRAMAEIDKAGDALMTASQALVTARMLVNDLDEGVADGTE